MVFSAPEAIFAEPASSGVSAVSYGPASRNIMTSQEDHGHGNVRDHRNGFRRRGAERQHAAKAGSHEEGPAARGARPRADQRFLLGQLHPPLAERTRPARRRQSLLLLRPRLDRHGAQHGPLDPLLRNARGDGRRGGGQDRLSGRSCARSSTAPCPSSSPGRSTRWRNSRRPSSTIRATGGASSRRATTRLPAWATVSSAIRRAWVETVKSLWPDFPVYGSMGECSECMTRLIGPQNHMLWMALEPERFGAVLNRVGQFYLDCAKAAIEAAGPWLDGFVIWGDVAYKKGTFMRPDYWRTYYKPWVKAIVEHCHGKGLDVIYHGCGNVRRSSRTTSRRASTPITPWKSRRAWTPLELRRRFGHRMAFCGNSDIQVWETRRPRGHPPRGAAQAQRRQGRRLDLPVRPLRLQRRFRPHLRLHRQARAPIRQISAATWRIRRDAVNPRQSDHDSHHTQFAARRRLPFRGRLPFGQLLRAAEIRPPLGLGDLLDDPGRVVLADLARRRGLADHSRHCRRAVRGARSGHAPAFLHGHGLRRRRHGLQYLDPLHRLLADLRYRRRTFRPDQDAWPCRWSKARSPRSWPSTAPA